MLIEIRGYGNQVLAPGCPPACHPSGRTYEFIRRGWPLFYVFTTNGDLFEANRSYDRFGVFARLNHRGDFAAAAAALAAKGYGTPKARKPVAVARPAARRPHSAVPTEPLSMSATILNYLLERYRPVFRRRNAIHTADGRDVPMNEACAVPDSDLIERLGAATDAPRYPGGVIKRDSLPGAFNRWAKVAWGDLIKALPDEDDAELGAGAPAAEEFRRLVREALLSQLVLGDVIGKEAVTQTERRSVIGWCERFAKPGPWKSIRSYKCWCKVIELPGGELQLMVAIRHEVFSQVGADRRLREMGATKFGRRAAKYDIGRSTPEERPHGVNAVVLDRGFIDDLTATRDTTPGAGAGGIAMPLPLVNLIRERVKAWHDERWPGATRTTRELLEWWDRPDRDPSKRQFFAQREAAETVMFLVEARPDFRQGIDIPRDEPGEEDRANGYAGFLRYACKMATGTGKTTVMGMLAAWSILNKLDHRNDRRFSDVVLVVCPNVTIRGRLRELDPRAGEASIYRVRDLVPPHRMERLQQGRVLVMNWHVFEPQGVKTGGEGGRVLKAGVPVETVETIKIGPKNTTARGSRYLTLESFESQVAHQQISVVGEPKRDRDGNVVSAKVRSVKYVESDAALLNRLFGREVGGKRNVLVMNDEAHHAYRVRRPDEDDEDGLYDDLDADDQEEEEEFFREATVWVEGLDRINKNRGINLCIDLSATPYFMGRIGRESGQPFPWVVSDFGLIDAIESGLVKIPQFAVRDPSGQTVPGYVNLWDWVVGQMTPAERGARRTSPKPEAVLKYANTPIAMMAADWEATCQAWEGKTERPPVFIFVCKNTAIAKVLFEWVADGKGPSGVPPLKVEGFRNNGTINTIRVDTKVVHETDTGGAKSDEMLWMRFTLDTVGKRTWPTDLSGRTHYPDGFEELAAKLDRPLHPPGRDVRCIVSVGMLTEGWDCQTVTHVVGLRPFQSPLLCEQVVGRGLRRQSYDVGADDKFDEEVAKVLGVPFDLIPLKATGGPPKPQPPRHHVKAVPAKVGYEIRFPRVEGYTQAVRNRVTVDWDALPPIVIDPMRIPPEVEVKAALPDNQGRPSLTGPGKLETVSMDEYRGKCRIQEVAFDLAAALTRSYARQESCDLPPHVLFPQFLPVVRRYLDERVTAAPPAEKIDVICSPYYGWVVERLSGAVRGDTSQGDPPEIPVYESNREPGTTADVSFWTGRDVYPVVRSHLNYVVADTAAWEQSAAYRIDKHKAVRAFVKNAGLGFGVPYLHNGQDHEFLPDFLIRLEHPGEEFLILETKGYDPLAEVKKAAAVRWCAAVNAEGSFGRWQFKMARHVGEVEQLVSDALAAVGMRRGTPLVTAVEARTGR